MTYNPNQISPPESSPDGKCFTCHEDIWYDDCYTISEFHGVRTCRNDDCLLGAAEEFCELSHKCITELGMMRARVQNIVKKLQMGMSDDYHNPDTADHD
jgi:hypothetical protein